MGLSSSGLASLLARNNALEEIDLSLEISPTPEDSFPYASISILLPHLCRLSVHRNVAGYIQLLNPLRFSNKLQHVKTNSLIDEIVTDVAAALTPFLPNFFLMYQPSNLVRPGGLELKCLPALCISQPRYRSKK